MNGNQSSIRNMWGWAAKRDYIPMNFLAASPGPAVRLIGEGTQRREDKVSDTTIRQLFQRVKDDFNGATKQKHQIDGVVISPTTRRTQP